MAESARHKQELANRGKRQQAAAAKVEAGNDAAAANGGLPPNTINYATIDPNLAKAVAQNPDGTVQELTRAAAAIDQQNPAGAPPPPSPTPGSTPGSTPTPRSPAPQTPAQIAAQQAQQGTTQSASAQINMFLQSIPGLAALDPTNQLGQWMIGQIASLYGQGITDPTQIFQTIESTMNNPNNDPQAKAVFDQIFPGYNTKIANGTTNADGSYTGISGYISYANQLKQFAQTAGLTNGTLDKQTIGSLWSNDVSSAEVSSRVTQGYVAAHNAWNTIPGFGDYLNQNYGMTQSDLASFFLNPDNATPDAIMQQRLNQGFTAGEAKATGMGTLSQAQAASLSAFLAQGNQSGLGGYGQVNAAMANQALTSSLGNGSASASAMANAGFETNLPGTAQNNPGVVTQNQLLGGIEGDAGALQSIRRATETRTAADRGGGGYASDTSGVGGVGSGSQQ